MTPTGHPQDKESHGAYRQHEIIELARIGQGEFDPAQSDAKRRNTNQTGITACNRCPADGDMLGNYRESQGDDRKISAANAAEDQKIAYRQGKDASEDNAERQPKRTGKNGVKLEPHGDHRCAIGAEAEEGCMAKAQRPRPAPEIVEAESEQSEQHDITQGRDVVVVFPKRVGCEHRQ